MEGFVLFDSDYKELNEDGFPVIHTANVGTIVFPRDASPVQPAYFGFKCPRGRGNCHYLRISGGPVDDGTRPKWQWNGSHSAPTMTPSINCLAHNPANPAEKYAGCGWHGWIRDGQYVTA